MFIGSSDSNQLEQNAFLSQHDISDELKPESILHKIQNALSDESFPLKSKLTESMEILRKALDEYGPKGLTLSFNGGKDCTVLLYLMVAARAEYFKTHPNEPDYPARSLYVRTQFPFPEVDAFVSYCVKRFNLDVMSIFGDMREALRIFLESNRFSKAILIGTRRSDPHGPKLQVFSPTDGNWPSVMRVHPILEWTYEDVWTAIRYFRIPYCNLYDKGYTSLGSRNDTSPNPALEDPVCPGGFKPAYALTDATKERLGRYSTTSK